MRSWPGTVGGHQDIDGPNPGTITIADVRVGKSEDSRATIAMSSWQYSKLAKWLHAAAYAFSYISVRLWSWRCKRASAAAMCAYINERGYAQPYETGFGASARTPWHIQMPSADHRPKHRPEKRPASGSGSFEDDPAVELFCRASSQCFVQPAVSPRRAYSPAH